MEQDEQQKPTDLISTWSEADQQWLKDKVPEALHTVAIRHGRKLFSLTMQAGASNHCFLTLNANIPVVEGKRMLAILSRSMDDLFQVMLVHFGYTVEQFKECRSDVERMIELTEGGKPAGRNVSRGGIILDS